MRRKTRHSLPRFAWAAAARKGNIRLSCFLWKIYSTSFQHIVAKICIPRFSENSIFTSSLCVGHAATYKENIPQDFRKIWQLPPLLCVGMQPHTKKIFWFHVFGGKFTQTSPTQLSQKLMQILNIGACKIFGKFDKTFSQKLMQILNSFAFQVFRKIRQFLPRFASACSCRQRKYACLVKPLQNIFANIDAFWLLDEYKICSLERYSIQSNK